MIRRIILDDYMAHVHTVIEPAAGLTVLIGPNNCGKSAVVHAMEMLCYNDDKADYAIRHGAKKASVTVEIQDDDGVLHTIVWWRRERSAGYEIDGRPISGIGRSNVPDDLHQYLKMPKIESASSDKEFLLHFGLQKSPIFLLDESSSRAAQFFASATDADKLVQMQSLHRQKSTDAKRKKSDLDNQIEQLDRQLQSLAVLPEIGQRLAAVESEYQNLLNLGGATAALAGVVQQVHRARQQRREHQARVQTLAALPRPPQCHDTSRLEQLLAAMRRAADRAGSSSARRGVLSPLTAPPQLPPTQPLAQFCRDLNDATRQQAAAQRRCAAFRPLACPPPPQDTAPLVQAIARIQQAAQTVARRLDAQVLARKHMSQWEAQIDQFLKDNPRCPACGQLISRELITSSASALGSSSALRGADHAPLGGGHTHA